VVEVLEAARLSMKERREVFVEEVRRDVRNGRDHLAGKPALVRQEAM
jgi:hypothetical protein